jgi:hypothetical protein
VNPTPTLNLSWQFSLSLSLSLSLSFALLQAVQFVLDLHFQVPTRVGFTMHQKVFQSLLLWGSELVWVRTSLSI